MRDIYLILFLETNHPGDSKLILYSNKRHPGAHHPSFERDKIAMEKSELDILDLIINVLNEHEKWLDMLFDMLDTFIEAFSQIQKRLEVLARRKRKYCNNRTHPI